MTGSEIYFTSNVTLNNILRELNKFCIEVTEKNIRT